MLQGTGTYIMRNDQTGLPIDTRQKLLLGAMTIAEFFTQVKYHNKPRIAHSLAHGAPDWWRTRPASSPHDVSSILHARLRKRVTSPDDGQDFSIKKPR